MPRSHPPKAFSLIELLVAIGIIALLLAILLPVLSRARDAANRTKCASNLRQFGQALVMYNGEFHEYPRTVYRGYTSQNFPPDAPTMAAFSGCRGDNPFAGAAATDAVGADNLRPADNDVTAALFLLIPQRQADARRHDLPGQQRRRGFAGRRAAGAAWQLHVAQKSHLQRDQPLPGLRGERATGYKWEGEIGQNFAVAADVNPGDSGKPAAFDAGRSIPAARISGRATARTTVGAGRTCCTATAGWNSMIRPSAGKSRTTSTHALGEHERRAGRYGAHAARKPGQQRAAVRGDARTRQGHRHAAVGDGDGNCGLLTDCVATWAARLARVARRGLCRRPQRWRCRASPARPFASPAIVRWRRGRLPGLRWRAW